ncbi:MAG: hypothetical protein HZB55_17260 [Deltaproteobacteria bacterium]|nr:hypothetical protein [Deltaproteobacteria bacterium]
MTIRWYPPLDSLFGAVTDLPLERTASVSGLLLEFYEREPRFIRYARHVEGEAAPTGLLVWRRGKALKFVDILEPEDEVEVLVLVTGG